MAFDVVGVGVHIVTGLDILKFCVVNLEITEAFLLRLTLIMLGLENLPKTMARESGRICHPHRFIKALSSTLKFGKTLLPRSQK